MDIIWDNPLLINLLKNKVFQKYLTNTTNFGTFIRFAENKLQRLYWNPTFNAGIPLSAKEKDPVYELIFMLHDFGHFILPDLAFTGRTLDNDKARKIYVNWRLLGESVTVIINEMLAVDFLKDFLEFKTLLKLSFDKPYMLYRIFKKTDMKTLFHASYMYFAFLEEKEFLDLIDKENNSDWKETWDTFNARYKPVARRGGEWTHSNFTNISDIAEDYRKWYVKVSPFFDSL